jgi:hypothetical protein
VPCSYFFNQASSQQLSGHEGARRHAGRAPDCCALGRRAVAAEGFVASRIFMLLRLACLNMMVITQERLDIGALSSTMNWKTGARLAPSARTRALASSAKSFVSTSEELQVARDGLPGNHLMNDVRHADFDGEDLFFIEGLLSELRTAHTRVNLLQGLQKSMLARRQASDTLAAVTGMHDMLAGASTMTWYDGEEMVNFAALLEGRIVCGSFKNASVLVNDDRVGAVVSRRGELLYVHSLRRTRDQLLLLPLNTYAGTRALLRSSIRHVCVGVLGMWLVIGGYFGISAMMEDHLGPVQIGNLISLGAMVAIIPILVILFSEVPSYRAMRHYGRYASAIFHVHGFPHPDDLHALEGMTSFPGTPHDFSEINAALALEKHAAKFP